MKILKNFLCKNLLTAITCGIIHVAATQPTYAQPPGFGGGGGGGAGILNAIKSDTGQILVGIQNLPTYLNIYLAPLLLYANSWLSKDDQPNGLLATYQAAVATKNKEEMQNFRMQDNAVYEFTKTFLMNGSIEASNATLPDNANRLSSTILIGKGQKIDPNSDQKSRPEELVKDYVRNLTGANYAFSQPPQTPSGKTPPNYTFFYHSIAAIQSFGNRILSKLLVVPDKNGQSQREFLMNQASSSSWFKNIGEEDLGLVLRHILMYDSQIYVQLMKLEKLQQDHVAAQAMTNTLLIFIADQMVGTQLRTQANPTLPAGATQSSSPAAPVTSSTPAQ